MLTTWEQYHYIGLVHKCILKEVCLSHEDGLVHQGHWEFLQRARKFTWSMGEITRDYQKLSTSWFLPTEASSLFLWWSVLTQQEKFGCCLWGNLKLEPPVDAIKIIKYMFLNPYNNSGDWRIMERGFNQVEKNDSQTELGKYMQSLAGQVASIT